MVDMYLVEFAAHAWDLALATDQLNRLDAALARSALEAARATIKSEYRDVVQPGVPFAAELPPPPNGDNWVRLAAFQAAMPCIRQ